MVLQRRRRGLSVISRGRFEQRQSAGRCPTPMKQAMLESMGISMTKALRGPHFCSGRPGGWAWRLSQVGTATPGQQDGSVLAKRMIHQSSNACPTHLGDPLQCMHDGVCIHPPPSSWSLGCAGSPVFMTSRIASESDTTCPIVPPHPCSTCRVPLGLCPMPLGIQHRQLSRPNRRRDQASRPFVSRACQEHRVLIVLI